MAELMRLTWGLDKTLIKAKVFDGVSNLFIKEIVETGIKDV